MSRYYSLERIDDTAELYIFGDVCSYGENSSANLSKALRTLDGIKEINVHINSYGGEVSEGWSIYNLLLNHPARVNTYADGFVCSIAAVIFMAGDRRLMADVSSLMIHNAWTSICGNASELRNEADNLDEISKLSAKAFSNRVNISEEKLAEMLENETWLAPETALEMGFATDVLPPERPNGTSQSAKAAVLRRLTEKPTAAALPTADEIALAVAQRLMEQSEQPKNEKNLLKFLGAI